MNVIYYCPQPPGTSTSTEVENHPLYDLMFDLESINPPHLKFNDEMNKCPSMIVHQSNTYLLRSPVDIELFYNKEQSKWIGINIPNEVKQLISLPSTKNPYVQLRFYYLFWSEKKTNDKLWMHDIPLHEVKESPSFYVNSGMIPVGNYIRNISVGLTLNRGHDTIKIKRGQPISSITLVGDTKIKLLKKIPSNEVLAKNAKNGRIKMYCPYTFSKQLFAKWL